MPRNPQQNSFIPKTDEINTPTGGRKRSGGSLFILFSLGLFVVAFVCAVGLFFYKQNVKSNLADRKQELKQARSGFDPALINELDQLDTRISTTEKLLESHTAITPVFPIIESVTLTSVSFSSMKIAHKQTSDQDSPSGNSESGNFTVSLGGIGPGYPTVALQSSELADHDKIRNPILSDFSLNNEGNVEFSVQFTIPKEELLYTRTNISSS
jgi:hypothetical protein